MQTVLFHGSSYRIISSTTNQLNQWFNPFSIQLSPKTVLKTRNSLQVSLQFLTYCINRGCPSGLLGTNTWFSPLFNWDLLTVKRVLRLCPPLYSILTKSRTTATYASRASEGISADLKRGKIINTHIGHTHCVTPELDSKSTQRLYYSVLFPPCFLVRSTRYSSVSSFYFSVENYFCKQLPYAALNHVNKLIFIIFC